MGNPWQLGEGKAKYAQDPSALISTFIFAFTLIANLRQSHLSYLSEPTKRPYKPGVVYVFRSDVVVLGYNYK
jgi:hypothetical protein